MQTGATPDGSSREQQGAGISAEQQALQDAVAGLEVICNNPPTIQGSYILWFHPEEFEAVNNMWERSGIEAVIDRYGEERRYHVDSVEDLEYEPGDSEQAISVPEVQSGVPIRLLQVYEMGPEDVPDTEQSRYFRRGRFDISEVQEHQMLEMIRDSELTDLIVPERDSVLEISLKDLEIVGLRASVEWYGEENWYGDGCVFSLSCELSRGEQPNIFARMDIDEQANASTRLFNPEFFETGYEGHDFQRVSLTPEQMGKVAAIIAELNSMVAAERGVQSIGAWLGNSFGSEEID